MLRWSEPQVGDAIIDIIFSINKQVQLLHNQDAALVAYTEMKPTLKNLNEIGCKIEEVEKSIKNIDGHRGQYLNATVKALKYFTRSLQGDKIPYSELLMATQELPSDLIPEEKALALKDKVDRKLTNAGYSGTTLEKVDKWLAESKIPADKVTEFAAGIIKIARESTLKRVISLPKEDGIDSVNAVRGVYWSGYSTYLGGFRGKLRFNIDRPWSEPTFVQVLVHEAYPGHQTFFCRKDFLFQQGKYPLEAAYYCVNTPTNALFEGGPEVGLPFLGWNDENSDTPEMSSEAKKRYSLALDFHDMQRIAQTNACYMVNKGEMDKEDALEYMKKLGLFNQIEAGNSYRFFTDPIQKTYYPAYYHGRWIIGKSFDMVSDENRDEYFRILYDTPQTVKTFIDAMKELTQKDFKPFDK